VIRSFRDKGTEAFFKRQRVLQFKSIERIATRKLAVLHAATTLLDLSETPGNRLEQLGGDRAGTYSIRINKQFRICFRWSGNDAFDVEIVDYH
jgi:toxin HigB-1